MSTPYTEVYEVFLSKVTDYDLVNSYTQEELELLLKGFLKSSIIKFRKCKQDLSDRNDTTQTFNITLTDEEIEILATLMIIQWITPNINTLNLLKQSFTPREFSMGSQANQLKELRELKTDIKKECSQLICAYSFSDGIGDLNS